MIKLFKRFNLGREFKKIKCIECNEIKVFSKDDNFYLCSDCKLLVDKRCKETRILINKITRVGGVE
jgi:hypothetical protein